MTDPKCVPSAPITLALLPAARAAPVLGGRWTTFKVSAAVGPTGPRTCSGSRKRTTAGRRLWTCGNAGRWSGPHRNRQGESGAIISPPALPWSAPSLCSQEHSARLVRAFFYGRMNGGTHVGSYAPPGPLCKSQIVAPILTRRSISRS